MSVKYKNAQQFIVVVYKPTHFITSELFGL